MPRSGVTTSWRGSSRCSAPRHARPAASRPRTAAPSAATSPTPRPLPTRRRRCWSTTRPLDLVSVRGIRRVPYAAFHTGYKTMDLAADELIAAVRLPAAAAAGPHQDYRKVGTRRAQAISKVCFAGTLKTDAGVVTRRAARLRQRRPDPPARPNRRGRRARPAPRPRHGRRRRSRTAARHRADRRRALDRELSRGGGGQFGEDDFLRFDSSTGSTTVRQVRFHGSQVMVRDLEPPRDVETWRGRRGLEPPSCRTR